MKSPFLQFPRLVLCLWLFAFPLSSTGQEPGENDLLQKLESAVSDSAKADIYTDLHNLVFKTNLSKAKEYGAKILECGDRSGSATLSRMGNLALARCARKDRNYAEVIAFDKQVLKHAARLTNSQVALMADNLTLARDYLDADQSANAEIVLNKCLQLSNMHPDSAYRAKLLQTFGWYHLKQHETDAAVAKYEQALELFTATRNEYMIAETKFALVTALLAMRETSEIPQHLFDAIEIYKGRNSIGRLGDCYGLLGQSYIISGNSQKGIESLLKAIGYFQQSQNITEAGLAHVDLGRCYLLKKDFRSAKEQALKAQQIFSSNKYPQGAPVLNTFWGQYYSATGEDAKADKSFATAAEQSKGDDLEDLRNNNNRYWAQHKYKMQKNQSGDSLLLSYAAGIGKSGEVKTAHTELTELIRKNPGLDKKTVGLLQLLFTRGGPELLQKLKGDKTLSEIGGIEKFLAMNPSSLSDSLYDQHIINNDNSKLLELETKYNTRIKDDSLRLQQQNLLVEKANSRRKDAYVFGAIAVAMLLGAGFLMQYKFRKRAVRDKGTIELLQGEIHHRLKNNLAIIRRLVDIAGKKGSDPISLQALQTRVAAIEVLHKHLYSEKITGNVSLQEYLTELSSYVQTTLGAEKNISIGVDAPISIDSRVAEKIGLITNELITNSIKYAFPDDRRGNISIIGKSTGNRYELKVTDDGVGFNEKQNRNFGLKLISGLSHEIDGDYRFDNNQGTVFTLSFSDNKN